MKLNEEQVRALVAWAYEAERPGGCSGWGKQFDGAMKVAQEVRSSIKATPERLPTEYCGCGTAHNETFCPNCGAARGST